MINDYMARIIHDDRMRDLRREADESRLGDRVSRSRRGWLSVVVAIVIRPRVGGVVGPASLPDIKGSSTLAELEPGRRL